VSKNTISELADVNLVLQSLVSSICNNKSQFSALNNNSVAHKEETAGFCSIVLMSKVDIHFRN